MLVTPYFAMHIVLIYSLNITIIKKCMQMIIQSQGFYIQLYR